MRSVVLLTGVLALAAGCEVARTQLVARVDSEVPWGPGRAVQSVTLTVRRGGPTGAVRSARTTTLGAAGGRASLPMLVGLIPADDAPAVVWVEALGCGDPNGCAPSTAVVAQRAVVAFVRGETLEVPLLLASACVGVACAADERCAADGRCEPATRAPVGTADAGAAAPPDVDDAALVTPADAQADAGSPADLGPSDAPAAADLAPTDAPADGSTAEPAAVDAGREDAPAPDVPAPCGPLELRCGGACVAVLRDPAHCGDCGVACPAVAGATAACIGGRCGYDCAADRADCDGDRANGCETATAADHDNCGACGRSCGALGECAGGRCAPCPTARPRWCGSGSGGGCTNTQEDAANCSGCGVVCPVGAVCYGGCAYAHCDDGVTRGPGTWRLCGDRCVNFDGDPGNCAACEQACPPSAPVCTTAGCVPR